MNTLLVIKEEETWLEIVNLIVPTLNDSPDDIRRMCEWIEDKLGEDVPLHFIRFFPMYQLTKISATPVSTLEMAYGIAKDVGLEYVYIGNVPGHTLSSTFCPSCGKMLLHRHGFEILENNIKGGKCRFCGEEIAGIW